MAEVSFVIVCYNHARYAARVAHFLRAQEGVENAQYVFVDDGSPDNTADAIAEATEGWTDTIIHRQANAGPSNAINQGIRLANRPFIKLVGGDDLLHPQATTLLHEVLVGHEAVYAFGELGAFDTGTGLENEAYWAELMPCVFGIEPDRIDDPLAFMLRRMSFNPSCLLLRTEDAQAVGGSDESVFVEDYSLSLRMALRGPFVHLPMTVAYAPEDDDARLSRDGAQTLHDLNAALAGLLRDYPDLSPRYRRAIVKRATGRGWLWARRRGGAGILSGIAILSLLSNLRLLPASPGVMEAACAPFRKTNTIRRPGRGKVTT